MAVQVIIYRTLSSPEKKCSKRNETKIKKCRDRETKAHDQRGTYGGAGTLEGVASGKAIRLKGEQELQDL